MLNLMMKTKTIDDIIWRHNKEMAINALYDDEMVWVDNLSTHMKRSDYRAK